MDAQAATAALAQQPTLLILDNVEAITAKSLNELLTKAKEWSEIGQCRVLLTTRSPDFHHPDYPTEGSLIHQSLTLGGLAEDDALRYFQRLLKLPPAPQVELPKREAVLALFQQVKCHPLSIGLIARQLKVREVAELGTRLETLLAETPDNPLLASLNLSLDRLDEEARRLLPKLGVFQGGAFENNLLQITEFTEKQWQTLSPALEKTGLIQPENLSVWKVPYLKFHPTLAPALWARLATEEQVQLQASHRQHYYKLSCFLCVEDFKNPHETRAIVQRELPNLVFAVHEALDAEEMYAVKFVIYLNKFLNHFGLNYDSKALNQRIEHSNDFLARMNKGEQLFNAGQYQAAAQVFSNILKSLGEQASYEHLPALIMLGRCFITQEQAAQGAECYRQGLAMAEQLKPSEDVKRQMGVLQTDLADALMYMGDYDDARKTYESALTIAKEQNDLRTMAVVEGQLGTLALQQGNLQETAQRYTEALEMFHHLNEPESEAGIYHQLGRVYEETKQWDAAEHTYREAARINESQGNLAGAAQTWNSLALVTKDAGKPEEAEVWYRKILKHREFLPDKGAKVFSNLACLLQTYPNRLLESRQLAEEALAIDKTLDPAAATIWIIYGILAQITEKQNDTAKASEYRRQSREAYQEFQGARYQLQKHGKLIAMTVAAVDDAKVRQELESWLETFRKGWENLAAAIQRILNGERDEAVLCEPLYYRDSAIINAILRRIAREV